MNPSQYDASMSNSIMLGVISTVILLSTGCDDEIIDDYGPPAGWSRVIGTVSRSNGMAAAQFRVAITLCEAHGIVSEDRTDSTGAFSLEASLPPVGIVGQLNVDTLKST